MHFLCSLRLVRLLAACTQPLLVLITVLPLFAHLHTHELATSPFLNAPGELHENGDHTPHEHDHDSGQERHCPLCVLSSLSQLAFPPAPHILTLFFPDLSGPVFYIEHALLPAYGILVSSAIPRGPPVVI